MYRHPPPPTSCALFLRGEVGQRLRHREGERQPGVTQQVRGTRSSAPSSCIPVSSSIPLGIQLPPSTHPSPAQPCSALFCTTPHPSPTHHRFAHPSPAWLCPTEQNACSIAGATADKPFFGSWVGRASGPQRTGDSWAVGGAWGGGQWDGNN